MNLRVGGKYDLFEKLGSGSFGEIYAGINIQTDEEVAVKLEPVNSHYPQLKHEYKVYLLLAGTKGIPVIHWFGQQEGYNIMVMDKMGPSLEDLFNFCGRQFSLKTVLMLADRLLVQLERIHSKGFLHRDLKPHNVLVGRGRDLYKVHLIDFGLSKYFYNSHNQTHIKYSEGKKMVGTARFASCNVHMGIEQSRRDDLESLCYMLMYFKNGHLPWQGVKGISRRDKTRKIAKIKVTTSVDVLCKNYPIEFKKYLNYCRQLRFNEKPDYKYLRRLFRDLFFRKGFAPDYHFDWIVLNYNKWERSQTERKEIDLLDNNTHNSHSHSRESQKKENLKANHTVSPL
jgi:serine/threonine protein kinase